MMKEECKKILDILSLQGMEHMKRYFSVLLDLSLSLENKKISKNILELGSGYGHSTMALALGAKMLKTKVYSVDMDAKGEFIDNLKNSNLLEFVEPIKGDDRLEETISIIKQRMYGIIFLDTSHNKEHTEFELDTYTKFLDESGYFILHDTEQDEVKNSILSFLEKNKNFVSIMEFDNVSPGLMILRRVK